MAHVGLLCVAIGAVVLKGLLIAGVAALLCGWLLKRMMRGNSLLFWCLLVALSLHLGFAGVLLAASHFTHPGEALGPTIVEVKILRPDPVVPKPVQPIIPRFRIPHGSPQGDPTTCEPQHGTDPNNPNSGGNQSPTKTPTAPAPPKVLTDPLNDHDPLVITGTGPGLSPSDITQLSTGTGPGKGPGGTPGKGPGKPPWGPPGDPGEGGRVYFLRLKHGSGAWNAYDDGITRLLSFFKQYAPCERESHAMTSAEIREQFLNKDNSPVFIYIYADDTFHLSDTDVVVLRDYMGEKGFLFVDSRPDPEVKARVDAELAKVLPGKPLKPIANNHLINRYLFRLPQAGVGENFVTGTNYGISDKGRLAVFYTMGNFAHLYSSTAPNALEYAAAQYQMGANVMCYAIMQGNPDGAIGKAGANATVANLTVADCEKMNLLETAPKPKPGQKPPSVKVPAHGNTNTGGEEPGEITVFSED